MQPGFRHGPVALHGGRRDLENLGRVFDGQPTEEAQLYDLTLLLINLREFRQGSVEGQHIDVAVRARDKRLIERDLAGAIAALGGILGARVIHKYPAHHLGSDSEEVSAALPT